MPCESDLGLYIHVVIVMLMGGWRDGGGVVEGWWRDGEGWWRDGGGMVVVSVLCTSTVCIL